LLETPAKASSFRKAESIEASWPHSALIPNLNDLVAPHPRGYNPPQMLTGRPRPFVYLAMTLALLLTGCALATKAPPRAYAGPDIFASVGETVSFDGSQSVDLDGGEIVLYQWKVTAAPVGREAEVGSVLREGPLESASPLRPLGTGLQTGPRTPLDAKVARV
jgi:hypothetical protein